MAAQAKRFGQGIGIHQFGALVSCVGARARSIRHRLLCDTPVGCGVGHIRPDEFNKKTAPRHENGSGVLRTAAICMRSGRLLREEIIGHRMRGLTVRLARRSTVIFAIRRAFALLHEPARQHGRGVFFHPGVKQLPNLLAQISGMAKSREFVALQRIAGSREQKLPRRLGFVVRQGDLLTVPTPRHRPSIYQSVIIGSGKSKAVRVWKNVERLELQAAPAEC